MSDCKTIYRKVNEFVHCLYPGELKGNLLRNTNTLSAKRGQKIAQEQGLYLIDKGIQ
jgi:hypothetical protein